MLVADLHMHSTASMDGTYTPRELVEMSLKADISTIAIADHNSVKGLPEALSAAADYGLELIPAIEIDTDFYDFNPHLLGYYIDYTSPRFLELENYVLEQEHRVGLKRIKMAKALGLLIDEELTLTTANKGIVSGDFIGEMAINDPRNQDKELIKKYLPGGSRSDNPYANFYWDNYANGKPGHVPISYPDFSEAVKLITETGGVPVLAHPGQTLKGNEMKIKELKNLGLRGIEVFSSYHGPKQSEFWYWQAKKLGLLITAGSDFHGKTKPGIKLGQHGGTSLSEEIVKNLSSGKIVSN